MTTISQDQFLNDIRTKIYQYVYRSTESPVDAFIAFLQEASGNGNLNWHVTDNKIKLASVFTNLATAVTNYKLIDGDFRSYLLLSFVNIVVETYEQELLKEYLEQGYNVASESIEGALSKAYSTQPPQNTNFPGKESTADKFNPEPSGVRLVPKSLYATSFEIDT